VQVPRIAPSWLQAPHRVDGEGKEPGTLEKDRLLSLMLESGTYSTKASAGLLSRGFMYVCTGYRAGGRQQGGTRA